MRCLLLLLVTLIYCGTASAHPGHSGSHDFTAPQAWIDHMFAFNQPLLILIILVLTAFSLYRIFSKQS